MAVALLALFVALGGTATAAKVMITSSKQIKKGTVSRSDLARNAVDGTKVLDGSLSTADFDTATKSTLQAGHPGAGGVPRRRPGRREGQHRRDGGDAEGHPAGRLRDLRQDRPDRQERSAPVPAQQR